MICNNIIMDNVELALHIHANRENIMVLGKHRRFYYEGQPREPAQRGTVRGLVMNNIIARCTPGAMAFIENQGDHTMQ